MDVIFENGGLEIMEGGRDAMRSNKILFPPPVISHVATDRITMIGPTWRSSPSA